MAADNTIENQKDYKKEAENDLVFSYLTLRNLIGFSGMLLPFILLFFTIRDATDHIIQPSVSDYYYTANGDVLVVTLCILGVFLFTYKGYTNKERILTIIAAICAIGVAFSPTATNTENAYSIHTVKSTVPIWFGLERHFIFAGIFFIALALISLIFFPRTSKTNFIKGCSKAKSKRNMVYKICGWTIIAALIIIAVFLLMGIKTEIPVVFIAETIAIEAFGLSWITKGQTLWPDGKHYIMKGIEQVQEAIQ